MTAEKKPSAKKTAAAKKGAAPAAPAVAALDEVEVAPEVEVPSGTAGAEAPVEAAPSAEPETILVRATVNLQGLRRGKRAHVDPSVPYIARCLETRVLVPVEPTN